MTFIPHSWAARIGVATLGAALATALATPAQADDTPTLDGFISPTTVGILPSPGKAVLIALQGQNAQNPRLTIDVSGLTAVATVDTPTGCSRAGDTIGCAVEVSLQSFTLVPLVVHATKQTKAGDKGTVSIQTSADNVRTETNSAPVTFGDGIDLAIDRDGVDARIGGKHPGDAVATPIHFSNLGSRTVNGVELTLGSDHGLSLDTFDNCRYTEVGHIAVCDFPDATLNPGDAASIETPDQNGQLVDGFGVHVTLDSSPSPTVTYDVQGLADSSPTAKMSLGRRASTGHRLRLVVRHAARAATPPQDIDTEDNSGGLTVLVVGSHFDATALGTGATGKVGEVVTVTVGARDLGPAVLDGGRGGDPSIGLTFAVPPHTQVVSAPDACRLMGGGSGGNNASTYLCTRFQILNVNESWTERFTLRITSVVPDDAGTVTLKSLSDGPTIDDIRDDNTANNTAKVLINPTAPPSPSVSPGTGGQGGGLPVTGTRTGIIAGVGGLAMVVGLVLTIAARRRRVTMALPEDGSTE
jgi:hypothetical protein